MGNFTNNMSCCKGQDKSFPKINTIRLDNFKKNEGDLIDELKLQSINIGDNVKTKIIERGMKRKSTKITKEMYSNLVKKSYISKKTMINPPSKLNLKIINRKAANKFMPDLKMEEKNKKEVNNIEITDVIKNFDYNNNLSQITQDHNSFSKDEDEITNTLHDKRISKFKSQIEIKENKQILNEIPIFKYLDEQILIELSTKLIKTKYINNTIISDREVPEKLYIISEGKVICKKEEKIIKILNTKDYFCDVQLYCYLESYYNYEADGTTILLELSYNGMMKVLGRNYMQTLIFNLFKYTFLKSEYFNRKFTFNFLTKIFETFNLIYYFKETVYDSNKEKKILLVISGKLFKNSNHFLAESGDFFGLEILDSAEINSDNNLISCEDECVIYEAYWNDILKAIKFEDDKKKPSSNKIVDFAAREKSLVFENLYDRICFLKRVKVFVKYSEFKLFLIADLMKKKQYKTNELVYKESSNSKYLYIVKSGNVKTLINDKFVGELIKFNTFGSALSLFDNLFIQTSNKKLTYISGERLELYLINIRDLEEVLEHSNVAKKSYNNLVRKDNSINLHKLFFIKELVKKNSSKLYLTHDGVNLFTLKISDIEFLYNHKNLGKYYLNEKKILNNLDHPLIMQIVNSFKDESNLFFIKEFVNGITLKYYLINKNTQTFRNLDESIFYLSNLLIVINYLHKNRIIHRNIKPDNIMIDEKGFLKLFDFGLAKNLTEKDYTNTIIGTPHYMAPEIILGKSYSFTVDIWACGIILYEIFYGILPYGNDCVEVNEIYKEILEGKIFLPHDTLFEDINNFLELILMKNEHKRICSFSKLINHKIFNTIDFDKFLKFESNPPFIPSVHNTYNIENFNVNFSEMYLNLKKNKLNKTAYNSSNSDDIINNKYMNEYFKDF